MRIAHVIALALPTWLACIKTAPVPCVDDTDCDLAPGGACVSSPGAAWCGYADPSCPTTMQRYSPEAGNGVAGTCVPVGVACTPDEPLGCDGDRALRCNGTGTAIESAVCPVGCSDALGGCRLCEPMSTTCTGGTVATCDADGRPATTRDCVLGCADDEPRCREVVGSNGLGQFLAEAANGIDLTLADDETFDETGAIHDAAGVATGARVPAHLVPAPAGGVPIVVLVVRSISIGTTLVIRPVLAGAGRQLPAMAVVAAGDITIRGAVNLSGSTAPATKNPFGWARTPPGAIMSNSFCLGRDATATAIARPGSGGGGNATVGADGGTASGESGSGYGVGGGYSSVTQTLEPLRGGCAGGHFSEWGGNGGGAIQLLSGTRVVLRPRASINAGGGGGSFTYPAPGGGGGGGSGGGILIEAPVVELGDGAGLAANGGGGGAPSNSPGTTGGVSLTPAPGGTGCTSGDPACTPGGAGGVAGIGPRPGVSAAAPSGGSTLSLAGGGGGAVGFIRINTLDATYRVGEGVILSPEPSTGPLRTR